VDGQTTLVISCLLAAAAWGLLASVIAWGRLRAGRGASPASAGRVVDGWSLPDAPHAAALALAQDDESRLLLERGLRSGEREVRLAAVTALGRLGNTHEWAIDGLVEALATGSDDPAGVAAHLDRLAPRPGCRLTPLLGHPNEVVRFYAVRLLGRYPDLARSHAPSLMRDASPHVRAGALETLRASASPEALRGALRALDDEQPFVRAHASRTASAIGGVSAAPFVAPLLADASWWVREAAREALVAVGREVAPVVAPLLDSDVDLLRRGAALVLQDVGVLDGLVREEDSVRLERILDAGGEGLRRATSERARRRLSLEQLPGLPLEQAS
jgi:HEAT repeat protein